MILNPEPIECRNCGETIQQIVDLLGDKKCPNCNIKYPAATGELAEIYDEPLQEIDAEALASEIEE